MDAFTTSVISAFSECINYKFIFVQLDVRGVNL
jgi:hypothetical protein